MIARSIFSVLVSLTALVAPATAAKSSPCHPGCHVRVEKLRAWLPGKLTLKVPRVFEPARYETITADVWVPAQFKTVQRQIWVQPKYRSVVKTVRKPRRYVVRRVPIPGHCGPGPDYRVIQGWSPGRDKRVKVRELIPGTGQYRMVSVRQRVPGTGRFVQRNLLVRTDSSQVRLGNDEWQPGRGSWVDMVVRLEFCRRKTGSLRNLSPGPKTARAPKRSSKAGQGLATPGGVPLESVVAMNKRLKHLFRGTHEARIEQYSDGSVLIILRRRHSAVTSR